MNKPLIRSWSFSRLSEFEMCAYRTKLKVIDKIPEPERELKKGQTEHANDRGTRIHELCEGFLRNKNPLPPEAEKFREDFESLKTRFKAGNVSLEGEWGFDDEWQPCDYNKAWLRVKCDAVAHLSPKHIVVIDYKTGRKHGNEIKHGEQVQLYALSAAIRYPEAEVIDVELWYLDQDDLTHESKPANKWLYHLKPFNNRGRKMMNETKWKPNPNVFSCNYCPYRLGDPAPCEHAVDMEAERMKKARQQLFARKNS